MVPPPQVANPIIPQVFYSTVPAEVILFDGQPTYTNIPGTQLVYANNTDSPLFVYSRRKRIITSRRDAGSARKI